MCVTFGPGCGLPCYCNWSFKTSNGHKSFQRVGNCSPLCVCVASALLQLPTEFQAYWCIFHFFLRGTLCLHKWKKYSPLATGGRQIVPPDWVCLCIWGVFLNSGLLNVSQRISGTHTHTHCLIVQILLYVRIISFSEHHPLSIKTLMEGFVLF